MAANAAMSGVLDIELKKAFVELQYKMVETKKKIQVIDAQINLIERILHHVNITQREISQLPQATKTYESVGRMFVLTELDEVKNNLKNRDAQLNMRVKDLTNNKKYLEKDLQESEDNLREMVQLKKEQSETKTLKA